MTTLTNTHALSTLRSNTTEYMRRTRPIRFLLREDLCGGQVVSNSRLVRAGSLGFIL